jgi:hypothetical protein
MGFKVVNVFLDINGELALLLDASDTFSSLL